MNVGQLIELLSELPEDIPVLVKDKRKEALVEVKGVLFAECVRDGKLAAIFRFEDDHTQYWWRGVSTPSDEWMPRFKKLEMREPLHLTSRLTELVLVEPENKYEHIRSKVKGAG
jgi:hypothetical protein